MSFFCFVVNTYEEHISTQEQNDQPVPQQSLLRGRPRNIHSKYFTDHPKSHSHQHVIRSIGHNTLPDIVGPFFPCSDDPNKQTLYFTSILALLSPWRKLHEIFTTHQTLQEAFDAFCATMSQTEKDIITGIQYYYECKNVVDSRMDNHGGGIFGGDQHMERTANIQQDLDSEIHNGDDFMEVDLTEEDLMVYEESQQNHQEETHGKLAVAAARMMGVFNEEAMQLFCRSENTSVEHQNKYSMLETWRIAMAKDLEKINEKDNGSSVTSWQRSEDCEERVLTMDETLTSDFGETFDARVDIIPHVQEHLTALNTTDLLINQCRAYDIINWHLHETLANCNPSQLLMIIAGEGGVGKSKTIQTITEIFYHCGVAHMLVKGAYTGIVASIIDGKTLHVIAQIPVNG